jgi:MraZ protein
MGNESTTGPLYFGTFERSMDAKKRVAVPSQWLAKEEGETFFIVPHPSGEFLIVLPPEEFMKMEAEANNLPPQQKRVFIRQFYGAARQVCTDKQGRILLPDEYCQKANLESEAVFTGLRSRFEIRNKTRHDQTNSDELSAYQEAADAIGL